MDIELLGDRSEKIEYSFTDFPIYIGQMFDGDDMRTAEPAHFHDDIELVAVLAGEISYNVNGGIITLAGGEGIIVNSRQMHFCCGGTAGGTDAADAATKRSTGGRPPKAAGGEFIKILLNPMLLCSITAYERDFLIPAIKRGAAYLKLQRESSWHAEIMDVIERLYRFRGAKTAPLKAQAAFAYILSLMIENTTPSDFAGNSQNGDLTIIKNMVSFIQWRYTEKITLAEIAAAGAVGQSKCCKLFAKYLAQTPNGYLNRYRLSKSTELLAATNMTVTQIAVATGFGGVSYYAEAFRRCYGKSPTEYRGGLGQKNS